MRRGQRHPLLPAFFQAYASREQTSAVSKQLKSITANPLTFRQLTHAIVTTYNHEAMSDRRGFTREVFRSLLYNPPTPQSIADTGLLQQAFWLNLLPFYFDTLNGHHLETSTFNVPSLRQSIVHVDVYSHRSYEDLTQPQPYSHLHLRVICAPDPFVTGDADDSLIDAFQRFENSNRDTSVAMKPWEKPVIIISRVEADEDMFARPCEWKGNMIYLASEFQRTNLCSDSGQADLHQRLLQWAQEGELVEREYGADLEEDEEEAEIEQDSEADLEEDEEEAEVVEDNEPLEVGEGV